MKNNFITSFRNYKKLNTAITRSAPQMAIHFPSGKKTKDQTLFALHFKVWLFTTLNGIENILLFNSKLALESGFAKDLTPLFVPVYFDFVQNILTWTKVILNAVNNFIMTSVPANYLNVFLYKPPVIFSLPIMHSHIFFSYLEGFDDVTANILIWNEPKLAANYAKQHTAIFNDLNREIMLKTTAEVPFIFPPKEYYYEFPEFTTFEKHAGYEFATRWIFAWSKIFYDPRSFFDTYDLAVSFCYEPYFFFWEKIQQSVEEFWLIGFIREWNLFFEDRVFQTKVNWWDSKSIFPPLSHLAYHSDLKSGWKILRRLYDYKTIQFFSYYLDYSDIQTNVFDKNFVHLWNYYKGIWHDQNHFGIRGWTGFLNYFREKLYSPRVQYPSSFYRENYGYGALGTWMLEFGFFPDAATLWGHYNPTYERFILGFNWFFHSGDTFVDAMMFLSFIWYSITENYWGEFELLADDYSQYQQAYLADNLAAIWLPMVVLLVWTFYKTPKEMEFIITDFNKVFNFWDIKSFKKRLTGDFLFHFDRRTRLALFRDPFTIDRWMFVKERLVSLFFGYNTSDVLINIPNWYAWLTDPTMFYGVLNYDTTQDKLIEESFNKLIFSLSDNDYSSWFAPSIYFTNYKNVNPFEILMLFINEKIFDDPGFFLTSLHRGEPPRDFVNFKWLDLPVFHAEYLPQEHYNWNIRIFNVGLDELWGKLTKFIDEKWLIIDRALDYTFSYGWVTKELLDGTLYKGKFLYNSHIVGFQTFFFKIEFYPLLHVLKWFWGPSKLDFLIVKFYNFIIYLNSKFAAPAYYIDFDYLKLFIDKFVKFSKRYNLHLTFKFFKFIVIISPFMKFEFDYDQLYFDKIFTLLFHLLFWLNEIFFLIFSEYINFLSYPGLTVRLVSVSSSNHSYTGSSLESYTVGFTLLPIEFFLPLVQWKNSTLTVVDYHLATNSSVSAWSDKQPIQFANIQDIEYLMALMALVHIIDFSQTHYLPKVYLDAINHIDMSLYRKKKLEYDRYLTYVQKPSYYRWY